MTETAKDFLKRRNLGRTRPKEENSRINERARDFLQNPRPDGVFFYPASANDFEEPLLRFAHKCDTFIFCDWAAQGDCFTNHLDGFTAGQEIAAGIKCTGSCAVDHEIVQNLGDMSGLLCTHFGKPNHGMHYNLCTYLGKPRNQWARYAELLSEGKKRLKFYFFCLEAVNLYQRLFTDRKIAAEILCIKNWGNIGEE